MKKGVVLVVVIGVMLVIFTLALAALFLMTQESRIAEHKIKRTKAFFAAQSGMVLALEQLRKGFWLPNGSYCLSNGVAPNLGGCTNTIVDVPTNPANRLPYDVRITVSPIINVAGPTFGTSKVDLLVTY